MAEEKIIGLSFKTLLILLLVMVVLTAVMSYTFLSLFTARDVSQNDEEVKKQDAKLGPTFSLGDFVVNLSGTGGYQFVRASIVVEVDDQKVVSELEKRSPQIRDIIILTLRDQKIEDIEEPGARVIKNQIMAKINEVLTSGRIMNVWFTQLVVQ
jgi:flagellar basal body-associated protein FliL